MKNHKIIIELNNAQPRQLDKMNNATTTEESTCIGEVHVRRVY